MSRLTALVAIVAGGFALFGACQTPTSITFAFRTDVDCSQTQPPPVAFVAVGVPDQVAKPLAFAEPTSTKDCDVRPSGGKLGDLGTLVALPKDDDGAEVGMVVVLGVTRPTGNCGAVDAEHADPWAGCIIARRRLGFLDGEALEVEVPLYLDCVGVPCDEQSTCVPERGCVSSEVDPNDCLEKSCGDDDLPQTGSSSAAATSSSSSDASSSVSASSVSASSSSSSVSSGGEGGEGGASVSSAGGDGGAGGSAPGAGGEGGISQGGGGFGPGGFGGDGGAGASGTGGSSNDGGGGGSTNGAGGAGGAPGSGGGGGTAPFCDSPDDCTRCSPDGLSLITETCAGNTCGNPGSTLPCEAYVCRNAGCLVTCGGNDDCQPGFSCDFGGGAGGSGSCVP